MSKNIRTHYDNLQVSENASPEVIRGAYRSLSQKWHPDKNPENQELAARIFVLVNEAYAVLSDPQRRMEHDLWIKSQRERAAAQAIEQTERSEQKLPSNGTPASAAISTNGNVGIVKRAWLMFLFVASTGMLLIGVPYAVLAGEFRWSYIVGIGFWLWVGYYAYTSLFYPEVIAEEKRQEEGRHLSKKSGVMKRAAWGAGAGVATFVLLAIFFFFKGEPSVYSSFGLLLFCTLVGALLGAVTLRA